MESKKRREEGGRRELGKQDVAGRRGVAERVRITFGSVVDWRLGKEGN